MVQKPQERVSLQHGGSTVELKALLVSGNPNEEVEESGEEDQLLHESDTRSSKEFMSLFSAILYGIVGLCMGFANKAVLQQWPYSNALLTLQMAASIVIVYALGGLGLIEVQPLELKAAKNLGWVVFFYNANVAFALAAVQALSIPVYHVMKRLTPVMVLGAKYFIGDAAPPVQVTLSVLTVVSGCVMSGLGDIAFDPRGYLWALTSCALQTTYLLLVERSGSEKGFTSIDLLLYNAVLSLPVLIVFTFLTGEALRSYSALMLLTLGGTNNFILLLVISLLMGSLLNFALFLCTIANSALTTTIVGTLRSVFGTILGFFVLGGVKATPLIVAGVSTNTAGGVWYTIIKYKQRHRQLAKPVTPMLPPPHNQFQPRV
eukprot:jgi/Mesen1/7999/ME000425S07197